MQANAQTDGQIDIEI